MTLSFCLSKKNIVIIFFDKQKNNTNLGFLKYLSYLNNYFLIKLCSLYSALLALNSWFSPCSCCRHRFSWTRWTWFARWWN